MHVHGEWARNIIQFQALGLNQCHKPTSGGVIAPPMGEVGACQSINWQGTELRWIAFYKDRIRLSLRQLRGGIGVKFCNHI